MTHKAGPFSLARAARRAQRRQSHPDLLRRLGHHVGRLWRRVRRPGLSVLLPVAIVGPLFAPVHWSLGALKNERGAQAFLGTLWQVEASIVALALAVILFAFEAFSNRADVGPGYELREFATDTQIPLVIYGGLTSLIAVGITLLGGGYGAPGGWAATWATLAAVLVGGLVAFAFAATLYALDSRRIRERVQRLVRSTVARLVQQDAVERHGAILLQNWCQDHGVNWQLFLASPPTPGEFTIRAPSDGHVRDLRIRRLHRFLQADGSARLFVRLGSAVARDDRVLAIDPRPNLLRRLMLARVAIIDKDE
jgi:hypothetical protein